MKRLAGMLLIGVLAALILQPVSPRVNSLFNNQAAIADGVSIPPKSQMVIAEIWPIPPIPPQKLASGAVWVA